MIEHVGIFPNKCIACRRCEVACVASHHGMAFKEAMKFMDVLIPRVRVIKKDGLKTSVRCHQCDPAPCCNICPTNALRQAEDGRITLNAEICIACKMCVSVCPYGTVSMDTVDVEAIRGYKSPLQCGFPRREVAVRCDVCYSWRMENGKKITACMEVCPVRALYLQEPDGQIVEAPAKEKKGAATKAVKGDGITPGKENGESGSKALKEDAKSVDTGENSNASA